MEVIGHQHEFVQQEFVLCAISLQGVEKQPRHRFGAKDGAAAPRCSGNKECADLLRRKRHKSRGQSLSIFRPRFTTLKACPERSRRAWCFHPSLAHGLHLPAVWQMWGCCVWSRRSNPAAKRRRGVSPGRESGVKWEIDPSRGAAFLASYPTPLPDRPVSPSPVPLWDNSVTFVTFAC